jgi:hypothetical protein
MSRFLGFGNNQNIFYGRESMGMFFKNKHMIYIRVI